MATHRVMDGMELADLLTGIAAGGAGIGGFIGGLKAGRSKQLDEILKAATIFEKSYNLSKDEASELKEGLAAAKLHQKVCEDELCTVKQELSIVHEIVKKHINPNYVPKTS
jgi:hypothetical protein